MFCTLSVDTVFVVCVCVNAGVCSVFMGASAVK